MTKYAVHTDVSPDNSQIELKFILRRYGVKQIVISENERQVMIGFAIAGRMIKMSWSLPDPQNDRFLHTLSGRLRQGNSSRMAYEQEVRSLWRAQLLLIHARLEAIEMGASTVEREFLADILLPSGQTVGEELVPQINATYQTHGLPPLLASPREL
jgi:hypothetical protein